MRFIIKTFSELSNEELFQIYYHRTSIFVVEQHCPYQEVDELDLISTHVLMMDSEKLMAYLRIIPPHDDEKSVAIGRVIAVERRKGYATLLLKKAIDCILEEYSGVDIVLEAQTYAKELYKKVGFVENSGEFLLDGIPHQKMKYQRGREL